MTRYLQRENLSAAELRTLEAMSRGVGIRGAADLVGYSTYTVQDHLVQARRVLQAKNTTHAVAEALRRGLIA